MKIAVMGAGSVGCYYGGMLARAGYQVVLIGRPQHVEAVQRDGLFLDTQSFQQYVPMQASTDPKAIQGAQLILCCVKSTDTASAAAEMAPFIAADATLLSLQNGVDNAECLQMQLGRPVAPAVVYVATEMAGPGHVKHHGRGELVVGPTALTSQQLQMFVDAGVPIQISDNVLGALWAKLILNCAYNALSAITQIPYGRLFASHGVEAVIRDVIQECRAVAQAAGVTVPGDDWETVLLISRSMPQQLSSTAQDLARHKPSEIDHLNGYIVRKGESLGVPTPANRVLHTLVKLLESSYPDKQSTSLLST